MRITIIIFRGSGVCLHYMLSSNKSSCITSALKLVAKLIFLPFKFFLLTTPFPLWKEDLRIVCYHYKWLMAVYSNGINIIRFLSPAYFLSCTIVMSLIAPYFRPHRNSISSPAQITLVPHPRTLKCHRQLSCVIDLLTDEDVDQSGRLRLYGCIYAIYIRMYLRSTVWTAKHP